MTLFVFGLVFASAAIHVAWNAIGKRSTDKVAFALATLLGSTALAGPGTVVDGRAGLRPGKARPV